MAEASAVASSAGLVAAAGSEAAGLLPVLWGERELSGALSVLRSCPAIGGACVGATEPEADPGYVGMAAPLPYPIPASAAKDHAPVVRSPACAVAFGEPDAGFAEVGDHNPHVRFCEGGPILMSKVIGGRRLRRVSPAIRATDAALL